MASNDGALAFLPAAFLAAMMGYCGGRDAVSGREYFTSLLGLLNLLCNKKIPEVRLLISSWLVVYVSWA